MFQDDAPDVAPSTEFTYYKKKRQQKAGKASENNSKEKILQKMPHSFTKIEPATAEHDVVTKTSSTTVPSKPEGSLHCISSVSTMPADIEAVSTESHVRRTSLAIPIALSLLTVAAVVNIRSTFTALI